jgi:hypothetical protein
LITLLVIELIETGNLGPTIAKNFRYRYWSALKRTTLIYITFWPFCQVFNLDFKQKFIAIFQQSSPYSLINKKVCMEYSADGYIPYRQYRDSRGMYY